MKNLLLVLCFLAGSYTNQANGQLIKSFGAKVALTSADQRFDNAAFPDLVTKRRLGFNIGGFVEWLNIPYFSVITQMEYAQRGAGVEFVVTSSQGPDPIGHITLYSRLDYLSVPVLAKITFPAGVVSPYVIAGPRLDILLGYDSDQGTSNHLYDGFKKSVIGGSAGIGVETKSMLPVTLILEARYNFDFADSFDNQFLRVNNNAFDFWLGVGF